MVLRGSGMGMAMAAAARWSLKLEEEGWDGNDEFIPEARKLREVSVIIGGVAKRMRVVSLRRS
jgi:hypothetical protein